MGLIIFIVVTVAVAEFLDRLEERDSPEAARERRGFRGDEAEYDVRSGNES